MSITPEQRDAYRKVFANAVSSDDGAAFQLGADRIAGRCALGSWYGLRAEERVHPISELGRRVLRFQIKATTLNSR